VDRGASGGRPLRQFKAELFKALAHPARIHILEILREGEHTVGGLQARLGIDASSVSQHLAILRARQIVDARKAGTSVHYRVRDPQLFAILDAGRAIFAAQARGLQAALDADPAAGDPVAAPA
jgi:DNA-binding transcriptional ArsR family regulator